VYRFGNTRKKVSFFFGEKNLVAYGGGGGGARCGAVVLDIALQAERSRVRFPVLSLLFIISPGIESASNINEYRGSLL